MTQPSAVKLSYNQVPSAVKLSYNHINFDDPTKCSEA
jgi:hypothetical protein